VGILLWAAMFTFRVLIRANLKTNLVGPLETEEQMLTDIDEEFKKVFGVCLPEQSKVLGV